MDNLSTVELRKVLTEETSMDLRLSKVMMELLREEYKRSTVE